MSKQAMSTAYLNAYLAEFNVKLREMLSSQKLTHRDKRSVLSKLRGTIDKVEAEGSPRQGKMPLAIVKGRSDDSMTPKETEQAMFTEEIKGGNIKDAIGGAFEGRPIDWRKLKPEERRLIKNELGILERESRVRGDRERAKFFKRELEKGEAKGSKS